MTEYLDRKQVTLTEKKDIINFNKCKSKILEDDPSIHKLTDIYTIQTVLEYFANNFKVK